MVEMIHMSHGSEIVIISMTVVMVTDGMSAMVNGVMISMTVTHVMISMTVQSTMLYG